jgi:hypothetical protein
MSDGSVGHGAASRQQDAAINESQVCIAEYNIGDFDFAANIYIHPSRVIHGVLRHAYFRRPHAKEKHGRRTRLCEGGDSKGKGQGKGLSHAPKTLSANQVLSVL